MNRPKTAILPGIFACIIGCAVLVYGVVSGNIDELSFSHPSVMLGGVFIALGLTLLVLVPRMD